MSVENEGEDTIPVVEGAEILASDSLDEGDVLDDIRRLKEAQGGTAPTEPAPTVEKPQEQAQPRKPQAPKAIPADVQRLLDAQPKPQEKAKPNAGTPPRKAKKPARKLGKKERLALARAIGPKLDSYLDSVAVGAGSGLRGNLPDGNPDALRVLCTIDTSENHELGGEFFVETSPGTATAYHVLGMSSVSLAAIEEWLEAHPLLAALGGIAMVTVQTGILIGIDATKRARIGVKDAESGEPK